MPLLTARNLSVELGGNLIIDGVDLNVDQGELVSLIGPNGSGKTTLVRTALGLQRPTGGEAWLQPGTKVGYMPQKLDVPLILPLNVRRFVALAGKTSSAQLEAALEEAGAGRIAGHPLQSLSGGEVQRVLLARAILREPDLLVLDEPAQSVDMAGRAELYSIIGGIRQRHGCGVLMVSHDLHLVMAATDRVVCLNHHVCCSGHPEAVSRNPEYLALFGAEAAEALAVYTHDHDHEHDHAGRAVRKGAEAEGREEGTGNG